jgi:serine/threonine protein phosphatase 1
VDGSIFAIGDIHGQHWRLVNLISRLPLSEDDVLVFVGDYIDRGPDTNAVIEFLIELKHARPNTVFLRGNHEEMMLNARTGRFDPEIFANWITNGGAETLESYPKGRPWWDRIPAEHWSFTEATILEYWLGPYVFVHAGFLPPDALWPWNEDPRLWVREEFLSSDHDFGAKVVFGHTPQKAGKPLVQGNKLGIDTAAAYGGPLTAVRLSMHDPADFQFFQV